MDNKSSNPIQKKLDSEIKKIREEHGNNLLTFNTVYPGGLSENYKSYLYVIITMKSKRIEEHRACIELKCTAISGYDDTQTMRISSRRVDKKKCEIRINFKDGLLPEDEEDYARQATPPIADAIKRDAADLLPWGRTIDGLQILMQSDLEPQIAVRTLFFLSGFVKKTRLFSRVVPDEEDTEYDEDVRCYINVMDNRTDTLPE